MEHSGGPAQSRLRQEPSGDLLALARKAVTEAGFEPDFPAGVASELRTAPGPKLAIKSGRDWEGVLWSSIDNDDSRDLDQVEYLEERAGRIHLFIGIADVIARVGQATLIDRHAGFNTTSIYTGIATFPMLPQQLSEGLTSLLPGESRLAWVLEMVIEAGQPRLEGVSRAVIRNQARLTYDAVGGWLEGSAPTPAEITAIPGLEEQLRAQHRVAVELTETRENQGAVSFQRLEARPVIEGGKIVDLRVGLPNPARRMIESFMVAANMALAGYFSRQRSLVLRRIVRKPERWERIRQVAKRAGGELPALPDSRALGQFLRSARSRNPAGFPELSLAVVKLMGRAEYVVQGPGESGEGHFGLGVSAYLHSTAPNRRYADLATQRLLHACVERGTPAPYTSAELKEIAARCTEREKAAEKVERVMRKVAAAELLGPSIGRVFEGLVTGASAKGTWVRLVDWPAEGKVVRGEAGLDVGDRIRVRLVGVNRTRGFIDFEPVR